MLKQFSDFIKDKSLIERPGIILLGISGGIDSMVMMDLFIRSGYDIAVAHCNFGLRGNESDNDQIFVSGQCEKGNIPFHCKLFETHEYSREKGVSLQMAARDLRYEWFNEIAALNGYTCIAIAHNKNDLAETFLINLARGTGIRGLTGIKPKKNSIIRPLLFACRDEITEYARQHNISYRDDSSNLDIKYKRNHIRHKIIPEFEKISPSFISTVYETAHKLTEIENIYASSIRKKFEEVSYRTGDEYRLNINTLLTLESLQSWLYEFLRRWNFPVEIIPDIISSLSSTSGKRFYSPTHRLVKDRDNLIIVPLKVELPEKYYIEEGVEEITRPMNIKLSIINKPGGFIIPNDEKTAFLDLDKIHFPLIMRKWRKGDYFQPLGLKGLKKLSDFFIDNKFSLIEKEKTWLLASGNKIIWIIGHRIDDRFKITDKTEKILMVRVVN
jgi:tRNA(Ile)-lysidine synthase